ncbi:MAG: hypothetical protein ACOY90_01740 [Candidatus Zhuqueibacterota bacterium]
MSGSGFERPGIERMSGEYKKNNLQKQYQINEGLLRNEGSPGNDRPAPG